MANAPITSSAQGITAIQQQLADVIADKELALANIASVLALGPFSGATFTITGKAGSEHVGITEYLAYLSAQVKAFAELELMLFQLLQDLAPYNLGAPQRVDYGIGLGVW